jgi:hypothetical protein
VNSVINPYEIEPLANPADDENSSMNGEEDEDGIGPTTLEARLEGEITLDHWYVYQKNNKIMFFNNIDICRQYCTDCLIHIWYKFQNLYTKYRCTCSLCQKELLADALEYRCCREVGPTLH